MKSLSEIETTVKRATKASGYSWGVAEETATLSATETEEPAGRSAAFAHSQPKIANKTQHFFTFFLIS